ncbi:MAG: bile acid:sodium symporter family protein [Elusimicrobia bacterium]|nr:bile acid:sodium symporter family protein [Elusimicrobiota bacterium]
MNILKQISEFVGRFMAVVVLIVATTALFIPSTGLWISLSWINYFLMVIMFGMGLTLRVEDFKLIFVRPRDVIIGCMAQFIVMPLLAFLLCKIFNLETALMIGVILVGACPGGTASNVITYLSKGDVALSVSMTSINTILAPFLTPAITYLILNKNINVDVVVMFISILNIVIVPIVLGFVINKFFEKFTRKIKEILPLISVIGICIIIASVVAYNAESILTTGIIVFVVVVLHNIFGYACGFGLGKIFHMSAAKTKAVSIEIGMQNSGLATSLANTAFPSMAMATVPGAIFSVWHNISGAILANIFNRICSR